MGVAVAEYAVAVASPLRSVNPEGRVRVPLMAETELVPRYCRLTVRGSLCVPGTGALAFDVVPQVAPSTWKEEESWATGGGVTTADCVSPVDWDVIH